MTTEQFQQFVIEKLESIDGRLREVEIKVGRLEERKSFVEGVRGWLAVLIASVGVIASLLIAWFK